MISCEERNLINVGQRKTLIGLSITQRAQSNTSTNVLHSSTTVEWKRYIDDLLSPWNVDKTEIEEFIVLANSHHPTQLNLRLNLRQKWIFLDSTLFKGERFNKQAILDIPTHFKPITETFQYTHFSSCHPPGVRKGFIKGEALRLLRTYSSEKSFVENITQFKTRLRARDYLNSLVERIKNNVRSQMKERHFNKERQCAKKSAFRNNVYHPALPNFKNILTSKWHYIKNQTLLREIYKHISTSIWAAFAPSKIYYVLARCLFFNNNNNLLIYIALFNINMIKSALQSI